jgi:HK97 family phage major capsid protein
LPAASETEYRPFGYEPRPNETKQQRSLRMMAGFGEQLIAIKNAESRGHAVDPRLMEINKRGAAAGASEAVPADGGFLVAPDFSEEIMGIAHDTGLVYTMGRKLPMSEFTNAIKIPGIDEQSRADGSRWGGVRMYWQNEADSMTGSKPKFRLIELVMKKLTGLFFATDELMSDSRMLGAVVTQAFGEEVGFKLDDSAVNGDGAGKPLGVLNSGALITIAKEAGQATATLLFQNVTKMWYRLSARSRKTACWFVNQDVEQQLLQMSLAVGTGGSSVVAGVAANGAGIYVPAGYAGNQYALMFGRPVIPIEQCQTLGTLGDIILADMSQWVYSDKGDVQQATSIHVKFLSDEQTFRWIYRVDGQPIWHTALTPFKGTNSQSPFVTLAARP